MNIESFIAETINGIVKGLNAASLEIQETGAVINPLIDVNGFMEDGASLRGAPKRRKVQEVEMNIAVTVSESDTGATGGLSINVVGVKAGLDSGSLTSQNTVVSNIKFSVPIAFPLNGQ